MLAKVDEDEADGDVDEKGGYQIIKAVPSVDCAKPKYENEKYQLDAFARPLIHHKVPVTIYDRRFAEYL